MPTGRKLRMGMIGGGVGSVIGGIHRLAAELDGDIALVAGAFSSNEIASQATGERYRIASDRCHADWNSFFDREAERDDPIDFVTVATPNHLHAQIALAAIDRGVPVFCEKPMATSVADAWRIVTASEKHKVPVALAYTYTGYPLVRQARQLVADGALGEVRKVIVEYTQDWLARPIEHSGNRAAAWRTDPARAGNGGSIIDIGVHAANLVEFVTGQGIASVSGDLSSIVPGRRVDDDCNVLLRLERGAPAVLIASQVCIGNKNGLRLRVFGERASIDWIQEQPGQLVVTYADRPDETYHAGMPYLHPDAANLSRTPPGHPEGYIEAFANLYREFADAINGAKAKSTIQGPREGLRGLHFVEATLASARDKMWTTLNSAGVSNDAY